MRLELGGGPHKLAGFVSIDREPWDGATDIVHDLESLPWPIADGSVAALYSCHVIEHIGWRSLYDVLCESRRVMAPGALCEHIWPEFTRLLGLMTHVCGCVDYKTFAADAGCPRCGGQGRVNPIRVKSDLCGWQENAADVHRNVISEGELCGMLRAAGFVVIGVETVPDNPASCRVIAMKPEL